MVDSGHDKRMEIQLLAIQLIAIQYPKGIGRLQATRLTDDKPVSDWH